MARLMAVVITGMGKLILCRKARKPADISAVLEEASCSSKSKEEGRFQSPCLDDADLVERLEGTILETPWNIDWGDIAELKDAKRVLHEAIIAPLRVGVGVGIPYRDILLFGPPGTGKSLLAKALANESSTTFFYINLSSFASVSEEESARMVTLLFEMARFYAPSTIFIDDIDSLCPNSESGLDIEVKRRVTSELRIQMNRFVSGGDGDELDKRVMVLATTINPWDVDQELRLRFGKRIYTPLPNREENNIKPITN